MFGPADRWPRGSSPRPSPSYGANVEPPDDRLGEAGGLAPAPMNSPLQPLDRRLLRNRRGALTLAAALAAFVALCWIVIQLHGSFPGDSDLISWMHDPHPGGLFAFLAHVFALLGNPIVAALLILAMGPLRIVDGAHWPSDVLAGYALGLGWTIVVLVIGLPWATGQRPATKLSSAN
jgi:hypothetical protein